jgi:ribonucleoside-diphosphate reductase alpha chain
MSNQAIKVKHRDGSKTDWDVSRIRRVVNWACDGLEAEPTALESSLQTRIRDGVTTRQIQENLISCALELCSPEEPDWRYVAGRLYVYDHNKEVAKTRREAGFADRVSSWVYAGKYDRRLKKYSSEELLEAQEYLVEQRDFDYDYAGASLLSRRYLMEGETIQEAYMVLALLLAIPSGKRKRLETAKRIYDAVSQRKVSLATPILANLRVPGGSLSSCYIAAMDDNLESIFETITDTARISKNGGGVGVNVSRVRATGSTVMGHANASGGVLPWMKLLNDTAIAVNQGGKRSGAVTVSLDSWHLDIPEFLECQTENGDQRRKSYDLFPQVVVTDEFMSRVDDERPQTWTLVDPQEVREELGIELAELWGEDFEAAYSLVEDAADDGRLKLTKQVNARELFKHIMRTQVETGLPYVTFKDTINEANPNQHRGYIPATNLCVESYSNVSPGGGFNPDGTPRLKEVHCCNLVSLNLAQVTTPEDLAESCRLSVIILDNTIELTNPPLEGAAIHNNIYRTIGVGAMGLADFFARRGVKYSSGEAQVLADDLFEFMAYITTEQSIELAKERGNYPAFDGSTWSQGRVLGNKNPELLDHKRKSRSKPSRYPLFTDSLSEAQSWQELAKKVVEDGIRNSHIMAVAPNTSSSLVQGCTASILPTYSRFFYDKWSKGTVPIAPPFIRDSFWFYEENKRLNQDTVVEMTATIQEWIDTGISMELLFNLNKGVYAEDKEIKAKDIFNTFILAWALGCKAIYYVRTVQKDSFSSFEGSVPAVAGSAKLIDSGCSSCAN